MRDEPVAMVIRGIGALAPRRILPLFLVAAILPALGCGSSVGELSGQVTYQKKPLSHGWIRLLGSDGVLRTARIEPDGSYSFAAVPVGNASFTASCVDPRIHQFAKKLLSKQQSEDEEPDQMAEGSDIDPLARFYLIPRKYEDITKSDLMFCIEPGSNTYDIDLQ